MNGYAYRDPDGIFPSERKTQMSEEITRSWFEMFYRPTSSHFARLSRQQWEKWRRWPSRTSPRKPRNHACHESEREQWHQRRSRSGTCGTISLTASLAVNGMNGGTQHDTNRIQGQLSWQQGFARPFLTALSTVQP